MNEYDCNGEEGSGWGFFVYSLVGILCLFIGFTI
ncbi:hypothetical protein, partial [Staphylococcus aureus]